MSNFKSSRQLAISACDFIDEKAHPHMHIIGIALLVIGALAIITGVALSSTAYFSIAAAVMTKLSIDAAHLAASISVIATGADIVARAVAKTFFAQRSPDFQAWYKC
jgi:hypothetical protein